MKGSTQRRSVIGRTLVLIGALFASGVADKKEFAGQHKSNHTPGMGWGSSAIFSPKRTKHKGFMRSEAYKKKHQR